MAKPKGIISGRFGAEERFPAPHATARGDLYHYLLTASWQMLIGLIAGCFVLANVVFAAGYYFDGGVDNARPGSFADLFFFSVQTMATIGYGKMAPVSLVSNVLVSCEAFSGLLGLALVTGLVFAKFSRPTARVRFSRNAVIVPHDGVPSLMFRMANLRGNRIVEAQIHVALARQETTLEGEQMRRLHDLALVRDRHPLFVISWTAIHPIAADSPLFGATPQSLASSGAQVVVSLTGLDETLSQTVHARHSYQSDDLVWGARFADLLSVNPDGSFSVDFARFDELAAQGAPLTTTIPK